ncbi:MAG TPA: hypothetical protein VE569_02520 [Acidimicrobiia bacterium]|nr:hypothetical protein [Acidimicrobiia bacterium]
MTFTDGATKKSLFIQVGSYDPNLLAKHLDHVYEAHKDPTMDDYIFNVVLNEIGEDGELHPNMDTILRYLPGEEKQAFQNVFIGSHVVRLPGKWITDIEYRWANLREQKALWQAAMRYRSNRPWHYYIDHEGVLDFFSRWRYKRAIEAFLIQSCRDAFFVQPNRAILWSPYWDNPPTWLAKHNLKQVFNNLPRYAPQGINWLHLQDTVGARFGQTKEQAVEWFRVLDDIYDWDSLRMNMDYFVRTSGGLAPADPLEVQARENWYEQQGIPVGASWELRWWMDNHKEL